MTRLARFAARRQAGQLHDHGYRNRDAIVEGMARTGSTVTIAAALLCVTFFALGLSKISFLQFFGIGTALASLLDAFVVRGVLVPSVTRLLGEHSWWAPRPLAALRRRVGLRDAQALVVLPSTSSCRRTR